LFNDAYFYQTFYMLIAIIWLCNAVVCRWRIVYKLLMRCFSFRFASVTTASTN